ncbi:MAG: hypothetical protein ACI4GV_08055 [Acutalibacteraceae bacterium]
MATITLTGNTIFGGVFNDTRRAFSNAQKSTDNLAKALNGFKNQINAVCAVSDVSTSVEKTNNSAQRETDKSTALSTAYDKLETFLSDVINIDKNVSEKIKELKEDFYNKYKYLKPDCEKNFWERAGDFFNNIWKGICDFGNAVKNVVADVGKWCQEHWKAIVTVVLVIAAVVVIVCTAGTAIGPIAAILVAAAKGLLIGAAVGGLSGGIFNVIAGKSFLEGFEEGAFSGAISGAIAGGLFSWLSGAGEVALSIPKQMLAGGVGDLGASLINDFGDIIIKGKTMSFTDILINAGFSFGVGALSTGATNYLGNRFPLRIKGINKGRGSWEHVWKTQSVRSLRHGSRVNIKTIMKGLGADLVNGVWDYGFEVPKSILGYFKDNLVE